MNASLRARVVLVGAIVALLAAGYGVTRLTAPSARATITSLDQAVSEGYIDAPVVAGLRAHGTEDAFVHLDTARVFAELNSVLGPDQTTQLITKMSALFAANKDAILAGLGTSAERVRDFEHLGAMVVTFRSEDALLRVARNPFVKLVGELGAFSLSIDPATGTQVNWPSAPLLAHGAGVAVGILDTGVDVARDDGMTNKRYFDDGTVGATYEATLTDDGMADDGGHGSHVSSIVHAVAPGATLYVADVFSRKAKNGDEVDKNGVKTGQYNNEADWEDIAAGADWLIDLVKQGTKIRAANLSIGNGVHHTARCTDDVVHFSELIEAGIVPVVAAGNSAFEDDDGNKVTTFHPGIEYPACLPGVISVGAVTNGFERTAEGCVETASFDEVASFSNSSDQLSLFAPGVCILGAGGFKSGTSMATPHVVGAFADLVSADTEASSDLITAALTGNGPSITAPYSGVTRHRLDANAAIAALLTNTVVLPTSEPVEIPNNPGGGPLPGGSDSGGQEGPSIGVVVAAVLGVLGIAWYLRRRRSPA
jgi:hypothetical protein